MHPRLRGIVKAYDVRGASPGELDVDVARALMNDPEVVFADEPTGNLDDQTGEGIHGLIRTLADKENKSFVVVTHKRDFTRHADRVLVLSDHRLAPFE